MELYKNFTDHGLPFLIANEMLVNFYERQHFIFQLISKNFYSIEMCLHDLIKRLDKILYFAAANAHRNSFLTSLSYCDKSE